MYPTVSDFLRDVFGWNILLPIQMYGFFVAIAFLVAGYILSLELKRKEQLGVLKGVNRNFIIGEAPTPKELITSAIVGFLLGFKFIEAIFAWSEFSLNPQDFILSGRGSWWGAFLLAAISAGWTYYEKKKQQLPKPKTETRLVVSHEIAGNLLVVAAFFGLLGTKIFHILENLDDFAKDPIGSILSFSGLTFFGGLFVGGIAMVIYAKRNNIKPLHLLDVSSVAVSLGYGIGRLGCQVSGDGCWGVVNTAPKPSWMSFLPDWLWAYDYPNNVNNVGVAIPECISNHCHVLPSPVFPTPLYEMMMMMVIFAILWSIRKRIKIPGMIFSIYLALQGIERFLVEQIRVNNELFGAGITQAEIISFILFTGGMVGVYLTYKNKEKLAKY